MVPDRMLPSTEQPLLPSNDVQGQVAPAVQKGMARKAALVAESLGFDYQESLDRYNAYTEAGNTSAIKKEVQDMEYNKRMQASWENIAQQAQVATAEQLAMQLQAHQIEQFKTKQLEQQYVETLKLGKSPEYRKLAEENQNIFQRKAQDAEFLLKLQDLKGQFTQAEEEENIFQESLDFVKAMLMFPNAIDFFNPVEGSLGTQVDDVKNWIDTIRKLPENEQERALEKLGMKISDMSFLLDNPQDVLDMLNRVDMSENQLAIEKGFQASNFLGALGWVRLLKTGGKLLSPRSITTDVDADTMAIKEVAGTDAIANEIVEGTGKLVQPEQALDMISVLRAPSSAYDSGISPAMEKALELNRSAFTDVLENFTAPQRLQEVLQREKGLFEQEYLSGSGGVTNFSIDEKSGKFVFEFGTAKGTPYASEANALKAAKDKGIEDFITRETPHGWLVQVRQTSPDAMKEFEELGYFGKSIKNIEDVVPGLIGLSRIAEGSELQIANAMNEVVDRSLRRLFGKKGANLRAIISDMQQLRTIKDGKEVLAPVWLNQNDFIAKYHQKYGRNPTVGEVEGYMAYRQVNDFGYELQNNVLMADVSARGDKMFSLTSPNTDASYGLIGHKVDNSVVQGARSNSQSILVWGGAPRYYAKGELVGDEFLDLKNYDILNVSKTHREDFFHQGHASAPVEFIAVPKGLKSRDVVATDLSKYLPGGRTAVQTPHKISVGRRVTNAAGETYRLSDRMMFSATSRNQSKTGAKQINEMIQIMKRNADDLGSLSDDVIQKLKLAPVRTVDEAKKLMDEYGLWDDDIVVQGVGDREVVQMGDDVFAEQMEFNAISGGIRNQLFGHRTLGTRHIDGGESSMLDPFQAMANSMNLTSRFASTTALRERSLHYLKEQFGDFLDTNSTNPYVLLQANIKNTATPGQANAIEAHQKFLIHMLGQPTRAEVAWKGFMDRSMNWVFDRKDKLDEFFGKGGPSRETLEGRAAKIELFGQDPVAKVRALTFHSTLGMLSLPSFIMQAINVTNIMAIAPKFGSIAGAQALPLRMGLISRDPKVIEKIAKHAKVLGFKNADEYKSYVNEFRRSGMSEIGNNHILIAGLNGMQLHSAGRNFVSNTSRTFFDQGELLNRITAYGTARKMWEADKALNKGLDAASTEGREWIANKAHTLTLGMSRADLQLGLRNRAYSIPFQFWSYPLRLTNLMLPKAVGGSTKLGKWEKRRLAATQVALWGGAGYPLLSGMTDYLARTQDMEPEMAKLMTNGAFDTALYVLSGGEIDSNMSDRVGNGQFYHEIWDTLTGDKNALEALTGASGGRGVSIGGALDNVYAVVDMMANDNPGMITDQGIRMLTRVSSGANNWFKLHLALSEGAIFSRNGIPLDDISPAGGLAMAFGLPPQSYADMSSSFKLRNDKQELTKQYTARYLELLRARRKTENPQEIEAINDAIRTLGVYAGNDGVQHEAMARALNQQDQRAFMHQEIERQWKDRQLGKEKFIDKQLLRKQEDKE